MLSLEYYPYMTKKGKHSILTAIDGADAREWLKLSEGSGTRFCKVEITTQKLHTFHSMSDEEKEKEINIYFNNNRTFTT